MRTDQPLPDLWLLSDKRNDESLDASLGSATSRLGFVYRHYHLPPCERLARFEQLQRIAIRRRHLVILADSAPTARAWGAEGIYGAPLSLGPRRAGLLMIATAHDMKELAQANRVGADAVMLSPVFATHSHPDALTLGPVRFRLLARHSRIPVVALGGMNHRHAQRAGWPRWAAIDGLSRPA